MHFMHRVTIVVELYNVYSCNNSYMIVVALCSVVLSLSPTNRVYLLVPVDDFVMAQLEVIGKAS